MDRLQVSGGKNMISSFMPAVVATCQDEVMFFEA